MLADDESLRTDIEGELARLESEVDQLELKALLDGAGQLIPRVLCLAYMHVMVVWTQTTWAEMLLQC